jgi:hypothetical protein
MVNGSSPRLRCREIGPADIEAIVNLLTDGFRRRSHDDWVRAFKCLSQHPTPPGYPKYGYLLECQGAPAGVILLIYSSIVVNGEPKIRCNICSWYVKPEYRAHAAILASRAPRHKDVTYFNVTPAPHTVPMLEAHGFVRYCTGWFAALPALGGSHKAQVKLVTPNDRLADGLQPAEAELLLAHANYGCISVTCTAGGTTYPFVFMPRRKFGVVPFVYLIYCRDQQDFVRFAGQLGRFLARSGFPLVALDSNGPIRGLVGAYFDGYPKYFKGPDRPQLGDLAYSELAMFRITGEKLWGSWRRHSVPIDITGETLARSK